MSNSSETVFSLGKESNVISVVLIDKLINPNLNALILDEYAGIIENIGDKRLYYRYHPGLISLISPKVPGIILYLTGEIPYPSRYDEKMKNVQMYGDEFTNSLQEFPKWLFDVLYESIPSTPLILTESKIPIGNTMYLLPRTEHPGKVNTTPSLLEGSPDYKISSEKRSFEYITLDTSKGIKRDIPVIGKKSTQETIIEIMKFTPLVLPYEEYQLDDINFLNEKCFQKILEITPIQNAGIVELMFYRCFHTKRNHTDIIYIGKEIFVRNFKTGFWELFPYGLVMMDAVRKVEDTLLKYIDIHKQDDSDENKALIKAMERVILSLRDYSKLTTIFNHLLRCVTVEEQIWKPFHEDDRSEINYYNLFPGFQAKLVEFDSNDPRLTTFLHHMKAVCADDREDVYDWIMCWFGYPIIHLKKTEKVLYLTGDGGSGMSTIFLLMFEYIYGRKLAKQLSTLSSVVESNNKLALGGKMFVYCDNYYGGLRKQGIAKFRTLVTAPTVDIKKKRLPKLTCDNYLTFASNSSEHVPITTTTADLWDYVCEVSNRYVGNKEYFDRFYNTCMNQEAGNIIYSYFRSQADNPKYQTFPGEKRNIVEICNVSPEQFLHLMFVNGGVSINENDVVTRQDIFDGFYIRIEVLYDLYKGWCGDNGIKNPISSTKFNPVCYEFHGDDSKTLIRYRRSQKVHVKVNPIFYPTLVVDTYQHNTSVPSTELVLLSSFEMKIKPRH